jgi:hypothetical protein
MITIVELKTAIMIMTSTGAQMHNISDKAQMTPQEGKEIEVRFYLLSQFHDLSRFAFA